MKKKKSGKIENMTDEQVASTQLFEETGYFHKPEKGTKMLLLIWKYGLQIPDLCEPAISQNTSLFVKLYIDHQ